MAKPAVFILFTIGLLTCLIGQTVFDFFYMNWEAQSGHLGIFS